MKFIHIKIDQFVFPFCMFFILLKVLSILDARRGAENKGSQRLKATKTV